MKLFSRLPSTVASFLLLIGLVFAVANRQGIYDWFSLRGYEPPQRIIALADSTTMQAETRKVFFVNHPELNDKTAFRQNCGGGEQTIVLGCFIEHRGIFLLDVTDPRLNGIVEVTAAHEVLHAAYERLNKNQKAKVDGMTANFYNNLNDERIKEIVGNYEKKDPSVVPNELHSILATEVKELTPELESYYAQYFSDRKRIVGFSEKYETTFTMLKNQEKTLTGRIESLKRQIDSKRSEYERQESLVVSEKERLDSLRASGRTDEYNAAVPGYNSEVNQLNAIAATINRLIAQHNTLVEEYQETALLHQELVESLDSNVETKNPVR
jgi:hypothetical protein